MESQLLNNNNDIYNYNYLHNYNLFDGELMETIIFVDI